MLLADDNLDMRHYVERLLRAAGYRVESAADGEAALAAARALKPDLVLSDVMMPRLDGFGLLAAMRADEATRDTPVILLSARAGEEAKVGRAAGRCRRLPDQAVLRPRAAGADRNQSSHGEHAA